MLRIMPAGRLTGDYQARLDGLTLGQLYREGVGQPIMTAFKQVLQEAKQFDFVFVDSRTGFSDEAGICTRDLADCLMIVMGLNRQNVEGTSAFLRSLREAGVSKTIRVALSPVPNGEDELVEKREKAAEAALSAAYGQPVKLSLQIPYHPRLALTEEPHIFRRSRGYLYDAYARIESAVLAMVGHSPDAFVRAVESAVKDKRIDVVVRHLERLRKLDRGSLVLERLVVGPLDGLWLQNEAGEFRRSLAAILPADSWAVPYIAAQLGMKSLPDAELFLRRALDGDPENAINIGNYANFLWNVRDDYDRAEKLYQQALAVDPSNGNVLGNYAYFRWKIRGDHDEAEALYKRARGADPENSYLLDAHARFLWEVRCDHDSAEALYKQARELDPRVLHRRAQGRGKCCMFYGFNAASTYHRASTRSHCGQYSHASAQARWAGERLSRRRRLNRRRPPAQAGWRSRGKHDSPAVPAPEISSDFPPARGSLSSCGRG